MASTNFRNFVRSLAKADIDFDTATFKTLLVSSVPTEGNFDSWVFRSDVTNELATAGGYVVGGVAQAFTLDALDTTNNRQPITFANLNPGWALSTFASVGCVIYLNTGVAATDRLITFGDFLGTVTGSGAGYILTYTTPLYITA